MDEHSPDGNRQGLAIVYVPCKDRKEATVIGEALIDQRLVACINIFPISSLYNWKGKKVEESESVMIAKSIASKVPQIEDAVKKMHSYEIPCILKLKADVNKEYAAWVNSMVA